MPLAADWPPYYNKPIVVTKSIRTRFVNKIKDADRFLQLAAPATAMDALDAT